jgi:two-component system NtrC family sensor kinase
MTLRPIRLSPPRSLRWQFILVLSALLLLVIAAGLLAIHALRDAAETTHQLAGERLVRMETAQELERQALLIGNEAERMWIVGTPEAMHASHAEVTVRFEVLDGLVDGLAAANDDVAILALHEANQLFRNSIHVAAGLREGYLSGRARPGDAKRLDDIHADLQRRSATLLAAAQDVSRQYTEDYRNAIDELARTSRRDQGRVLGLLVGSLVVAWLVSHYFLGRRIIDRLREVSHHLRRGEVVEQPARVPVQGNDEIAEMARAVEQFLDDRGNLARTQSQLVQAEKLAAIGQLAAGIAHEINNPVGFVSSNLSTLKHYIHDLFEALAAYEASEGELSTETRGAITELKRRIDIGFLREDVGTLIAESTQGLQRVTRIVQDLKDFSHIDKAEVHWADLERGLDSTLNVVANELADKTEVIKEYGGIPEVECIAAQINQVFMNLLINAAQAIVERGSITIRTAQEGDHVRIEIADTGCGIRPEHLKRIFDPFFTTRPVGKGTGLGLSHAYGVVQRHGGSIAVSSEPGVGTTFRITLPIHATVGLQAEVGQG